jgi:pimeloyl-ACP methyl ester carboxylesterase
MNQFNSTRVVLVACVVAVGATAAAQRAATPVRAGEQSYTIFLRSRQIGQERVLISSEADGWLVRGTNRLEAPIDVTTRVAEIHYDKQWRPTRLLLDSTSRGQEVVIKTTFASGQASSEISVDGKVSTKSDAVADDTIVLSNVFLSSYAALARRLVGQKAGTEFRGYLAPQLELPMRVDGVFPERIETPQESIAATRYSVIITNPPPGGVLAVSVWTDSAGALLRVSIPAQSLDLARDDVASAAARMTAFSLPGDESVRIPASGFNLAASVTKPANATEPLPALILIGSSDPVDRDESVAGIPVFGQLAGRLVEAGFLVVRYDKRGVGQSGGRTETATINDYSDDVRAIISWLDKQRKDVDKDRIGLVGHSEGAWVALTTAARDKRVAAVVLVAGASTTGSEVVLEQQRHVLEQLKTADADRQAKIELQKKINTAAMKGSGWEGIPEQARRAADTPWFQSFLSYDPARVMRDVRQPILIVQGALDTEVPPQHADRLAELARARKRKVAVDVVKVPGVNHLLVPAKTGEVSEYAVLPDRTVSAVAATVIATWMMQNLK